MDIENLEDHELLSLVLGHGSNKESVFESSQRICQWFKREELIHEKNFYTLKNSLQLGDAKTAQLMACFELGRRFFTPKDIGKSVYTAEEAYNIVKNMEFLNKECVRGLYVNSRFKMVHDEILTIGSQDANVIHPREIFRPAIEYRAYGIILVHNHPTGDPTPSQEDISVTKRIHEASKMLQIPLLDHLIIGSKNYISLQKSGFLC